MISKDIVDYIKTQINKGQSKEDVKKALVSAGWQVMDIEEAFKHAESGIPLAPAPYSYQAAQSGQNASVLSSPTDLLKEAWNFYKTRLSTFIGITLIPIAGMIILTMTIVAVLVGSGFFKTYIPERSFVSGINPLLIIIFITSFIGIIILQLWSQAALLFAIKDSKENIGIKESYRRGWHKIGSIFWVGLLSGIIVMGGYLLFIIPGIIFGIWFSIASMIVVVEGLGGMTAILKSKSYVSGYWWEVFWRLLFLGLILGGIGLIFGLPGWIINFIAGLTKSSSLSAIGDILSFAGSIVGFVLAPISVIYTFLVYKNLKAIKGEVKSEFSSGEKIKFILAGLLGIILVFGGILASIVLVSLNSAKDKMMDTQRQADLQLYSYEKLQSLNLSLKEYSYDHNNLYPLSLNELVPEYRSSIPEDKKNNLFFEYRQLKNGDDFSLCTDIGTDVKKCFNSAGKLEAY